MAKRVYLIWKDPTAPKTDDNWIQLSGKEFQEFCKTESARHRYFIRMGDDVRDDSLVFLIAHKVNLNDAHSMGEYAQSSMVTDVYSRILDEGRQVNAKLLESAFYEKDDGTAASEETVCEAKQEEVAAEPGQGQTEIDMLISISMLGVLVPLSIWHMCHDLFRSKMQPYNSSLFEISVNLR